MSQKIIRLSEEVINQIAAGEVVENPASVVKEMVENSLDAGASRIDIWIEGGGVDLIRIEDDGCGMGKEDALLSLERHATSKIKTESDLQELCTLGFRGEALAAISAVSCLELKTSDGKEGTHIKVEGGKVLSITPCARNKGTSIYVRSLFFNVPARKKFMKSVAVLRAQVIRTVETIVLAHSTVRFSLYADENLILEVFAEEKKRRIEAILGTMPHIVQGDGIFGLLGAPEEAKLNRRGQYLFINQRPIVSPLIAKAVKAGFGTRIAEDAYPSFALFLTVPPEEVDVNVHPQKREVRFLDDGKMFRFCEKMVAKAFDQNTVFASSPFALQEETVPYQMPFMPQAMIPSFAEETFLPLPKMEKPLAIIEGCLLLLQEELIIVDLALAHARVLAKSLKDKVQMQTLLWPLEAIVEEEEIVEELQEAGIDCRWIGKKTIAVDALPAFLDASDFPAFLQSWREERRIDGAAFRYAKAVKKRFSLDEALFLWQELQKCSENSVDFSGKNIWTVVSGKAVKRLLEGV